MAKNRCHCTAKTLEREPLKVVKQRPRKNGGVLNDTRHDDTLPNDIQYSNKNTTIGLKHLVDGVTNPKYKLLHFLTTKICLQSEGSSF